MTAPTKKQEMKKLSKTIKRRNHEFAINKGIGMIDTDNKEPRTVKTPDGFGRIFGIDHSDKTVIVKIPEGDKQYLRVYPLSECEEVPDGIR